MIFLKLYSPDSEEGGGDDPKKPVPPKNYKPLSSVQRRDWNDFLDYLQKSGVAGSKELDQPDKNVAKTYIDKYKKENPNTSVSEDLIPSIQYEQQAFRTGESFPGMSPEQLKVLRQQVNPAYLQRPTTDPGTPFNSTLSREYYPSFKKGEKNYGTDMEGYLKDFSKPAAQQPAQPSNVQPENLERPKDSIPLPNYSDPESRITFAKQYAKKYNIEEGYGDIPLRLNETPLAGSTSVKNIAINSAKLTGIDPALLYTSAMVEGASGTFHNQSGKMAGSIMKSEDPEYPILGAASYGLNNFISRIPEMQKKGYLPTGFEDQYKKWVPTDEKNKNITDSALFKTSEAAMTAKAARLKLDYDEIDDYAKKEGIKLSPAARDFFSLAHYNSGLGKKMLEKYNKSGYLKGDSFLKENPDGSYPEVYKHVMLRIKERDALKKEKLFDNGNTDKDTAQR